MALEPNDFIFNNKNNNIKKKYKHKQTGDIASYDGNKYEVKSIGLYIPDRYIENSNDWELIPSIEVGKVYKAIYGKSMFLVKEILGYNKFNAIGFGQWNWYELSTFYSIDITEATKEEWFERLKEEAIKRGLVKGARIELNNVIYYEKLNEVFLDKDYSFCGNGFYTIMDAKTGKWATVIEDKKPIKLEPIRKHNESIEAHVINISSNHVVKKPILTTYDGVELFEGDKYWYVLTSLYIYDSIVIKCDIFSSNAIRFSTKEKAQEYVNLHQKKYSLNDINEALNNLKNK